MSLLHILNRVPYPIKKVLASEMTEGVQHWALTAFGSRMYCASKHDQLGDNAQFLIRTARRFFQISLKDPDACRRFINSFDLWDSRYKNSQAKAMNKEAFVTYTEDQTEIPFNPSKDHDYAEIMFNFADVAFMLLDKGEKEKLYQGLDAFDTLHVMATDTFNDATSCMARYEGHNRVSLGFVQANDLPVNCSPSLHVADSLMMYNLLNHWGEQDNFLYERVKRHAIDMNSIVLYVKQHTYADIAAGRIACEVVCDLHGIPYDGLEDAITDSSHDLRHPTIDFSQPLIGVEEMRHIRRDQLDPYDLPGLVRKFYEIKGYPTTPPKEWNVLVGSNGTPVAYDPPSKAA